MSSGEPRRQADSAGGLAAVLGYIGRSYATLGLLALGVGLILMILITLSGFGGPTKKSEVEDSKADAIEDARAKLEHDADVGACRAALQEINVALSNRPKDQRPPAADPEALARLKKDLNLSDEDAAEIGSDSYTALDGQHLAGAFLFRDAATHALQPEEIDVRVSLDRRPTALDRATAAFAWAVREVRLAPPTPVNLATPPVFAPTPPQFVVRRGSGTPLERALVFLDLLDQLNATGPKPFKVTNVQAAEMKVTVKDDAGKEWPVAVGGAVIRVDGAADKKLDDLKEGMSVAVEGRDGRTTAIDAWTAAPPPALLGCLVFCDGRAAPSDPWACGVIVNGKPDVYLFDPRLGMPIPGAGGAGVATLADVAREPVLLQQLNLDGVAPDVKDLPMVEASTAAFLSSPQGQGAFLAASALASGITNARYDVTPEQAAKAELHLVCSLSSLAPRMQHLQETLLPPVRVSLYHNLDRETQLFRDAAAKAGGAAPVVKFWANGPTVLRRFLPPEEGGADRGWPSPGFPLRSLVGFTDPNDDLKVQMPLYRLFQLELAPWDVMPPTFHNLDRFPYNVGLGLRVRDNYLAPFSRIALEPQGPRDLLLRGDFEKAAGDLVGFSARMEQEQKRIVDERKSLAEAKLPATLEDKVNEWADRAVAAYAAQIRAQEGGTRAEREAADKAVNDVWTESASIRILLEGASSGPGLAEVTYQLGLCKHEKAEQAQARLELLRRQPGKPVASLEIEDVKTAWMDALGWWKKYGDAHPEEVAKRPSTTPGRASAVRLMRARAQAMLGDWKAAVATYEDTREPPLEKLEQLAALYRAQQLKKAHAADKP